MLKLYKIHLQLTVILTISTLSYIKMQKLIGENNKSPERYCRYNHFFGFSVANFFINATRASTPS